MRVLLVTDWLAARGGVEAYTGWLRAGLRGAGDEVRLLTSSAGSAADGSADFVAWGTDRVVPQVLLQVVNPFAVARVREALRAFRPDVALVNMFTLHLSPAVLAPLRAVPTVLSVHEYKVVCPLGSKLLPDGARCTQPPGRVCLRSGCLGVAHWLRDQPRYALIRAAVERVDRVLACSAWLVRELAAHGIEAEHLPLPVPAPSPWYRRAPAPVPTFLFCGGLRVEKGVPVLLRAFAALRAEAPAVRLRVVGEGAERPALQALAHELGVADAVTFTGQLPPAGVERELAAAWALVVPSLWAEPFGLVAVEAIVRGVPVVASAEGGLGETVEPGTHGLLFPNGDAEALGRHLREIAGGRAFPSRALAPEVVRRAAEAHDLALHVTRLRAIFEEVMRARRAA